MNAAKLEIISCPTWLVAGVAVQFVPVANVPGFSHRVVINGKAADWLSNKFKPGRKRAVWFYAKHADRAAQ